MKLRNQFHLQYQKNKLSRKKLTKTVQYLHTENYKSSLKEIKNISI